MGGRYFSVNEERIKSIVEEIHLLQKNIEEEQMNKATKKELSEYLIKVNELKAQIAVALEK